MKSLLIISYLLAICLAVAYGQFFASTVAGRTTGKPTARPSSTTGRPASTTASSSLKCVCSCCSGLRCKPMPLQSFADSTCTTKACKEKCKVFEPKHCDHTIMGTNDAHCTV